MLTPEPTEFRSASVFSSSSGETEKNDTYVYNGVLERREGRIIAKKSKHVKAKINAATLPTIEMRQEASATSVVQAEKAIRGAFHGKVRRVPMLNLENKLDSSTPSLDFKFIKEYQLTEGVHQMDLGAWVGCERPCRPNMGSHCGCELPSECLCLEYAAVNEPVLAAKEPELFQKYMRMKAEGHIVETQGLPKRFPYHKAQDPSKPQTLVQFYREQRHPIYECNVKCHCGPVCKSRVVQKGRKVPLTIFKTKDRGWGVYCNEELIAGEFIDTYLGEVITNEEADRREAATGKEKSSYLYSLDKFIGDDEELTEDTCYVVDGQYMGGPTRFINHSCEPNCRQYTVSYNKHDLRLYDLAFFATEYIPPGTELTFDYMDKDEEEEEEVLRKREEAARDPSNTELKPCNCGASKCRGYLWV
jgi:[histone H3]-lysine9 N-trimethyltransferase SUV39H